MKIRQGFISNSSSSSFLIKDSRKFPEMKEYLNSFREDCFIYRGKMYTTFISDMVDANLEMKRNPYAEQIHEGAHGGPYYEEEYIKVNGLLGNKDVFIPVEDVREEDYKDLTGVSVKEAYDFYIYAKSIIEQDIERPEDMIADFRRILKVEVEDED